MTDDVKKVDSDAVSIFDLFETDAKAEEDGRWFNDVMGDGSGIDLKVRRITSMASVQARRRLDKGYKKYQKNGVYPDDIAIKIITEQAAEAILIDWRNVRDKSKEPIAYSKEAALALLTKLPVFRELVLTISANLDNFRVEDREDTLKN